MPEGHVLRRWSPRLIISLGAVALVWVILGVLEQRINSNLVVVLLLLLIVTLSVGAFSGIVLGCLDALAFVLLVNWYLIPPVHTLAIESTESLVALFTFTAAAITASILNERVSRARTISALSLAQTALISRLVEEPTALAALKHFCNDLGLDSAHIGVTAPHKEFHPLSSYPIASYSSFDVPVVTAQALDDYQIVGFGPERIASSKSFVDSLASAVARAYESELLESELANSLRLQELDEARSALLASLGHDLRTPLSAIRVAAETLDLSMPILDPLDRQELVQTIQISSKRLEGLVTNLLDVSRIQSGALICNPVICNVAEVLNGALTEVSNYLISSVCMDAPTLAWCDPVLLDRVFVNILLNAVNHQGGHFPIKVSCETSSNNVIIKIVDHGIGIPAEAREQALRPFGRINGQNDGGTGAGLYIADAFLRSTNGSMTLEETPGGGLTVRISIPKCPQI